MVVMITYVFHKVFLGYLIVVSHFLSSLHAQIPTEILPSLHRLRYTGSPGAEYTKVVEIAIGSICVS